ncbi:MAG: 3-oxoacyl-ACP reductase FabG [Proteobacteria bacterium]|nr:3-oxoacyl-ACP reductase FabG [Pseudomonadota bacterium]
MSQKEDVAKNVSGDHSDANKQRVALVTGASRGIGLAAAQSLCELGFQVAIHYRSKPELAKSAQLSMPHSQTFCYDLSVKGSCEALMAEVSEKMGTVSVLVNNAGMSCDGLVFSATEKDFDLMVDLNYKATFLLSKYALKPMMKQRWGRIINITSVVGHVGHRGQSVYCSTKSAITAFTQSLAAEAGRFGVLCNCIAPGYIDTQMTAAMPDKVKAELMKSIHLGKVGKPQDIGNAVAFLASHQASYITGTTLHINGGMQGC